MDKIDMLYELCEIISEKLRECLENLKAASGVMSVSDIDIVDKLTHALKCVKTTLAMIEEEEDGESYEGGSQRSRRSYEGSRRSYEGGSRRSYEGGNSGRRGRSPRTGRYVSRDSGYSSHDGLEDIMEDIQDMPEAEKRRLKKMLEQM